LAKELSVSRGAVFAAFEQLMAEGYLVASVGAGTRVADGIQPGPLFTRFQNPSASPPEGVRRVSGRAARLRVQDGPWLGHAGAFRASSPALGRFPASIWGSIVARHARSLTLPMLAYGDPMGHPPLREAIATYLGASRGVRCRAEQIMIVSGSQQGLQIASRALLDDGDAVLMEDPGYPGAHAAFLSAGLSMVPVPIDEQGIDIAEGRRRAPCAKAAYVTPSHQYPLGVGMSATRRLQLLQWASNADAWIIEDDYDSEFRFGARPVLSLQGLDTQSRVIYLGTFSKVMFPALRLGYLVIPEDLVSSFCAVREAMDIFAPTLTQAALGDFISEGHFARHLRRMRLIYERRRRELVRALAVSFGDAARVVGIEAGMHLALQLADGCDDVDLARRASIEGLSVIPLSSCFLGEPSLAGLVLGYGSVDEKEIAPAVDRLARVVEASLRC
jgi:GntR family transcriptional regulator/MocR family aminotransferase